MIINWNPINLKPIALFCFQIYLPHWVNESATFVFYAFESGKSSQKLHFSHGILKVTTVKWTPHLSIVFNILVIIIHASCHQMHCRHELVPLQYHFYSIRMRHLEWKPFHMLYFHWNTFLYLSWSLNSLRKKLGWCAVISSWFFSSSSIRLPSPSTTVSWTWSSSLSHFSGKRVRYLSFI